jgi:hypothetical protein
MAIYNVIAYTTTDGECIVRVLAGAPDKAVARCRSIAASYEQEIVRLRLIGSTTDEAESHRLQASVNPFQF